MGRNSWVWKSFSIKQGSSLAQCTHCKEEIDIDGNNTVVRLKKHLFKHGLIEKKEKLPLSLQTHFTVLEGLKARCTYCNKIFSYKFTTGTLNDHLRNCHFEKLPTKMTPKEKNWESKWFSIESGSSVKCTRCQKEFNEQNVARLRAHLYAHGITEKGNKFPLLLQRHFTNLGEYKARCNYCGKSYSNTYISRLYTHLRHEHEEKLTTQIKREDSNSSRDTELNRTRAESGITSYSQRKQQAGAVNEYALSTSRPMDYVRHPFAKHERQKLPSFPVQSFEQTREITVDLNKHAPSTSGDSVQIPYAEHQNEEPLDLTVKSFEQTREVTVDLNKHAPSSFSLRLSHSIMTAEDAFNFAPQLYGSSSISRSINYVKNSCAKHRSQELSDLLHESSKQTRKRTGPLDEIATTSRSMDSNVTDSDRNLTPLSTNYNTTGYDSDSSKPVKLKSRWRRLSELEMGGSNAGFGSIIAPMSMLGSSIAPPSESGRYAPVNIGESMSSDCMSFSYF